MKERFSASAVWWFIVIGALYVIAQSASNAGIFDDATSILPLLNEKKVTGMVPWHYVFENTSGPLGRPVSVFAFRELINVFDAGFREIKLFSLVLHGSIVLAALSLNRLFLGNPNDLVIKRFVEFAIAIWATNPLWISTLLYAVQMMAVLSAFFTVLGFWFVGKFVATTVERRNAYPRFFYLLFGCLSFILAVLSKENGLIYIVALLCLLPVNLIRDERKIKLYIGAISLFVAGFAVVAVHLINSGLIFPEYSHRSFDVIDRLLTQYYLIPKNTVLMLLSLSQPSLVHDNVDVVVFPSLEIAISTIYWSIVAVWVYRGLVSGDRVSKWSSLCILTYHLGHIPESTIVPLELHFDHRYYAPSIFGYCGVALFAYKVYEKYVGNPLRGFQLGALSLLLINLFLVAHFSAIWSSPISYSAWEYSQKRDSARATLLAAEVASRFKNIDKAYELSYAASQLRSEETQWDLLFRNLYLACGAEAGYDEEALRLPDPSSPVFYDNDSIFSVWKKVISGQCPDGLVKTWLLENEGALQKSLRVDPTVDKTVGPSVTVFLRALVKESELLSSNSD